MLSEAVPSIRMRKLSTSFLASIRFLRNHHLVLPKASPKAAIGGAHLYPRGALVLVLSFADRLRLLLCLDFASILTCISGRNACFLCVLLRAMDDVRDGRKNSAN